jgi:hypothetical protein
MDFWPRSQGPRSGSKLPRAEVSQVAWAEGVYRLAWDPTVPETSGVYHDANDAMKHADMFVS